jgi:two-component system, sensor histidine kinase LadS
MKWVNVYFRNEKLVFSRLFLFFMFLMPTISFALDINPVFELTKKMQKTDNEFYLAHYHDKTDSMTVFDVLAKGFGTDYYQNQDINLGQRNISNWFLLELFNTDVEDTVYFSNELYFTEKYTFYLFQDDKLVLKTPTQGIRMKSFGIVGDGYFVPIVLEKNIKYKIILHIDNKNSSLRPIFNFYSQKGFQEYKNRIRVEQKIRSFIAGILVVILLGSLFLFFWLKEKVIILYFLFSLVMASTIFYHNACFHNLHIWFAPYLKIVPSGYLGFWMIIFSLPFSFEMNKNYIKSTFLRKLWIWVVIYMLLGMLASLFINHSHPYFVFTTYSLPVIYIGGLFLFILYPTIAAFKKSKTGYLFLFSYVFILYNTVHSILYIMKIIPTKNFKYNMEISIIHEILVMSVALVYYVNEKTRENNKLNTEINSQKEKQIEESIAVQNKERGLISRELHDNIGQQLTGLRLMWYHVQKKIGLDLHIKKEIDTKIHESIEQTRLLSHIMMPSHLVKAGLNTSLEVLCETASSENCMVIKNNSISEINLDETQIMNLYRITQEAIANAQIHGKATQVMVNLFLRSNSLILTIQDNGIGFDTDEKDFGLGLKTLSNRVLLMKGELDIESSSLGTNLFVKISID